MSNTKHHGKYGEPKPGEGNKRRAAGYEYWGRDAYMGSDRRGITRGRRRKRRGVLK